MLTRGAILQHYRIGSKIGEGAMGVVYDAVDTRLQRAVAIKVLPVDKVSDAVRKGRFIQEAKAASALNHPNIITIYDVGSAQGMDYIVMEYVGGQTLEHLIGAFGMSSVLVTRYGAQIADALAKAHAVGIVHRDLKPSNIMVTDDGRIKVLDFGIAKLIETLDSPLRATATTLALTEEGAIIGTAAYMSPEQAEGRHVDQRSDIFSFGTILYELATGQRPFTGDSPLAVLTKVLSEDPQPPSTHARSIPPDLEKAILRCLRKDPARRYQTMADLKVALEDVETQSPAAGTSRPSATRSRLVWAAAAALVLLLIGATFAGRVWRPSQLIEPLSAVAVTTFPGQELYPSLSPDGKQVSFSWNGPKQDNQDIYVQMLESGTPLRLTHDSARDYNPVWSPDGRWIAFLRGDSQSLHSELRLIPPLGGPERQVATIAVGEIITLPMVLAWCPDSTCLVVSDSTGEGKPVALFALSLETGERRQLTWPEPPALGDSQPAISPDGRWLIFRRNISGGLTGDLHILRLTLNLTPDGQPTRLTPATLDANHPAWMPDSREVIFSARERLWRLAISGDEPPARLPFVGEDGIMPAISRVNRGDASEMVYVRSFADTNIWRIETPQLGAASLSSPVRAISSTRQDGNPQLSPDGRRVAFVSNRSGDVEIWVSDLDGANAFQLTTMRAPATGTPRWSPDGTSVAFNSNLEGHWDVYVVAASGGRPRRLTTDASNDSAPSFSRDGHFVYFNSNRTGEFQIWKVSAMGGDAVQVTRNGGYIAFESADGKEVYYTQTLAGPSALWRVPVAGGEPLKVLDGVVWRNFVVLERGIYYVDQVSGESRLRFFDLATRIVSTVATGLGDVRYGLSASSDGHSIFYTRVDSTIDDLMLVTNFQ